MKRILIKNGTIVTSTKTFDSDILIENGKIISIDKNINDLDSLIIEADGNYIFPGGIDPHVHLDLQTPAGKSSDNFYTGSKAAIAGGTTCLIDFVTPEPGQSLIEALFFRKQESQKSLIDYSFHMSITEWNENTAKEMRRCVDEFGITSFKTYLAYKGQDSIGIEDSEFINVLAASKAFGAIVTVHAEHGDIINYLQEKFIFEGKTTPEFHPLSRPAEVEAEAVNRAIMLSNLVGCPIYFVHISTEKSVNIIAEAQENGIEIYAETCPQYLIFDQSVYLKPFEQSSLYVISPPLRTENDQNALWNALSDEIVTTVGTDHCPFNFVGQKEKGINDFTNIPNGAGGIEHRMQLLYTYGVLKGNITLNRFVSLTSEMPAKIFGLYGKKGDLKIGFDADIVIWNPTIRKIISADTHFMNCDSNIYEGIEIKGSPEIVIAGGKIVFQNEEFVEEGVFGSYLLRTKL